MNERGLLSLWSPTYPNIHFPVSSESNRSNQSVIDGLLEIEHVVLICIHSAATF